MRVYAYIVLVVDRIYILIVLYIIKCYRKVKRTGINGYWPQQPHTYTPPCSTCINFSNNSVGQWKAWHSSPDICVPSPATVHLLVYTRFNLIVNIKRCPPNDTVYEYKLTHTHVINKCVSLLVYVQYSTMCTWVNCKAWINCIACRNVWIFIVYASACINMVLCSNAYVF